MKNEEQDMYAYFLDTVFGIGERTASNLLDRYELPQRVYNASEKELETLLGEKRSATFKQKKKEWNIEKEYEKLCKNGIEFVPIYQKEYPSKLREIPDRPFALYIKGKMPLEDKLSVAMVGARKCSEYGSYIAKEFAKTLAGQGVQIISGMARGIDGISQQAALEAGGNTYGVLGCGVDICYPLEHKNLYEKIISTGGILSTYPPGTQPKPQFFPPRNRIISGLSDAILVVEARQKSGTLITVDMALEQGREVFCIPGRLTDRLSDGCNKLIQQGAEVVLSPEDLTLKLTGLNVLSAKEKEGDGAITGREKSIYNLLDFYPQSIEQIREKMKVYVGLEEVSLQETMFLLLELTLKGWAECTGGNYYFKKG